MLMPPGTKTISSKDKLIETRQLHRCITADTHMSLYILTHLHSILFMATVSTSCHHTSGKTPSDDHKKGVKFLVDTAPNMRVLPPEYVLALPPEKPILASHDAIPMIDLSGLDGPIECRMMTVEAIASACAHWGFFRIINHGIEISLMEEMLKAAEGFFELPWEEKMKYASEDVMNPVRYGTSLNTSKEHALHWRDYLRHFGHPIHKHFHLWPPKPPNYRAVTKEYLEEIWKLAMKISGAISKGLGLEWDYTEKSFGEGCQIFASNYYPPCPQPDLTLGLAAHSDHGGLTILMQNEVDGLQVKHDGAWVPVHHVPASFVVNIGDYIEILSNGRYESVEHRGVVNAERTRISVAVGHGPEMTAMVAPASPLVDEKNKTKYRPTTYKDYMRAQQSSAVRGKSPLQDIMISTTTENA